MKEENKNKIDQHIFSKDLSQWLGSSDFIHRVTLYGVDQNTDAIVRTLNDSILIS